MEQRYKQKPSPAGADRHIYEAIQDFVENPDFSAGSIETEHIPDKERLDGMGRIGIIRIVVMTNSNIDDALSQMLVRDPDSEENCDDPCKRLREFFKSVSQGYSFQ